MLIEQERCNLQLYTGEFDSDEAMPHSGDPHRPHQRLLKRRNAPGGGDLRISYSYTPIEGVNGCIYDVKCLTDEDVAALDEPSLLIDTDTSSGTFGYGDVVTYGCARAKEFRLQNDSTVPSVEYRCQWDGTWAGDPTAHPQCECKSVVSLYPITLTQKNVTESNKQCHCNRSRSVTRSMVYIRNTVKLRLVFFHYAFLIQT